jgi:hypothetical protein
MRIKFSAQATVFSSYAISNKPNGMRQFPANVINRVIVCNKDGCSYQHITNVKDGKFDVDFDLVPVQKGARLCNTLKFHFYTGNSIPIVVAAGSMPMEAIINQIQIEPTTFRCNFAPLQVHLNFDAPEQPLCADLSGLDVSTTFSTDDALRLVSTTSSSVSKILTSSLDLKTTCGAPMFCNLITAHNMQDEATTHFHFQSDVEPTMHDSKRFYKTGLTMTALAEALHANCLTADEVLSLDESLPIFTHFVSGVCQSYVRSAHICPYVSDKVLAPSLDSAGQIKHMLSESFKLPLREPFDVNAGFLCADDCEGQATFILHLFRSFQHLYERYNQKPDSMNVVFPTTLFNMSAEEKLKLWNVAMKVGKAASQSKLRCDLILISAGGAALGDSGEHVGGHATCVLVNNSSPETPVDLLMEGTNSMMWEDDDRNITVLKNGLLPITIPLVQVANLLTQNLSTLMGDASEADSRKVIHMNKQLETKFYRTAFCQNGMLLASVGDNPLKLNYGINMDHISDYKQKVLMPVTAQLINKITQQENAYERLQSHFGNRKSEIHPPPASKEKISQALRNWSQVTMYKKNEALRGRTYKVCLSMKSIRDPDERHETYKASITKLAEWNAKYKDIGFCDSYVAFDTFFTRLCMWTDNISALQAALSSSLSD